MGRRLAERRRLGGGVRRAGPRHAAQRGARPGLGGAARRSWSTSYDDDEVAAATSCVGSLRAERASCAATFNRGLAAARADRPGRRPVVGAGLPAAVRAVARARRGARAAARGRRRPGRSPTCRSSTPPGSGSATPRRRGARRRQEAAVAAEREQMAEVVDHLIAADDSELQLMTMLRAAGPARRPRRRGRAAERRPGPARRPVRARRRRRGAGADRRRVADAAAPLPVAQLHHRRRPRAGPARVHRVVARAARADRAATRSSWRR